MTRIFWVSATLAIAADQLSKWLVVHAMDLKSLGQIEILPPLLNFHMAWNRGVNFGLFQASDAGRWILIALSLVICGWIIRWLRQDHDRHIVQLSGGLLVGGALGNVIDRLIYGAVADFLNMSCCGITNPFAFNIADVAIFTGAIGLVLFTGTKNRA